MKYYLKKNKLAIAISVILFVAAYIFCLFINNVGFSGSDLEIKKYEINLKINKDGSGSFNNYITYDFSNVDYTVIYEDIGYKKGNIFSYGDINEEEIIYRENKYSDKASFDYDSFVTKVYQDNQEIKLTQLGYSFNNDIEMDTLDRVEAPYSYQERIFCYYKKGYDRDTTFNYQYKINGMVSKYLDIGIINWILSPQTDISIENLSVNISFEEVLNNEYVEHLRNNLYIHGNIEYKDLLINTDGISFNVEKQKSFQSVEVRLGFNNSLVNDTPEDNTYKYNAQEDLNTVEELLKDAYEAYNNRYYKIETALFIIIPILILFVVIIWIYAYKKYDKERVSEFDSEYYRELPATYPPAELGYLYNFKDTTKDDLSATIMDLIRKGYISLDSNGESTLEKKPNYIYRYNQFKDKTPLKSYEKFVLDWYFNRIAHSPELTLNQIDEYLKDEKNAQKYLKDNEAFIKLVREEARKNKFFDETRNINIKFSFIYILLVVFIIMTIIFQIQNYYTYALVFGAIGLGLFILLASYISSIKRRSINGNEDYVRWKAFRNFLLEFGSFKDYTMPLIDIWEHYMVYAVSFGIADEVEKQMRLHFVSLGEDKQYEDYISYSPTFYYRPYIYVSRSCRNASTVARSTIAQAQAARAGKAAGSFGGGRSFGGGGGGHGGR